MSVADLLSQLTEVDSVLEQTVRDAAQARRRVSEAVPESGADPETLHEFLRLCRAQVDHLEGLLGDLILFKGKVEKALGARAGAVEDAEVAALQGKMKTSDYTSAKERTVEFALHSLDEKRKVRQAEALLMEVKAAYEYVKLLYWGADATRKETDTRIRAITLATSLER